MRIIVAAVGRARAGPERDLFEHYRDRIRKPFSLELKEVEEKRTLQGAELRRAEAGLLLAAAPPGSLLVALDEGGGSLSSPDLAKKIGRWRDDGRPGLTFVIGGADGLDARVRDKAGLVMSFGAQTWPHMLVRGMLAEQLYRAQCILAGHPYHRR